MCIRGLASSRNRLVRRIVIVGGDGEFGGFYLDAPRGDAGEHRRTVFAFARFIGSRALALDDRGVCKVRNRERLDRLVTVNPFCRSHRRAAIFPPPLVAAPAWETVSLIVVAVSTIAKGSQARITKYEAD